MGYRVHIHVGAGSVTQLCILSLFSILVENATIPIRFEDYDRIYDLEWTELLQVDGEMPFAAYEELEKGMEVLAPWKDGKGSHTRVHYSKAFVVSEDDKVKEKQTGIRCQIGVCTLSCSCT